MNLNPFAIACLITTLTCSGLALLIYRFGKTKLHRHWVFFHLSVAGWAACVFAAVISIDPNKAYAFWKLSHIIGIYISIFFFHATRTFCNLNYSTLIKISYLYGIIHNILHIVNNGNFLYEDIGTKYLFDSMYYLAADNILFPASLSLWIFLAILGNYELLRYYKKNKNAKGHQARLIYIFSTLGFMGGFSTFLPMLGVNFYPLSILFVPIYAFGVTYIIFKHQFLDIKILIQKSLVYSILLTLT